MYNDMYNAINFSKHLHNLGLVNKAQDIINDFMEDKNYKLYIYDDAGNTITPVGKVHIVAIAPIIKTNE